jgi:chromosome segregation ATPase
MSGRRRLSDDAPAVREDPVVEVRESQLRKLKITAFIGVVGFAAAILYGVLLYHSIGSQASKNKAVNDRIAKFEKAQIQTNNNLRDSIAKKTDPAAIAKIATQANADRIYDLALTLGRVHSITTTTADSLRKLESRVATVEGQTEALRSNLQTVTNTVMAQSKALSAGDSRVTALEQEMKTAKTVFASKISGVEKRLDSGERSLERLKNLNKLSLGVGLLNTVVNGVQVAYPKSLQKSSAK